LAQLHPEDPKLFCHILICCQAQPNHSSSLGEFEENALKLTNSESWNGKDNFGFKK
jgi:hypothetical protein